MMQLQKWNFKLDDGLKEYLNQKSIKSNNKIDFSSIKLKRNLFPFQKEGVEFIEQHNGNALIGSEMGLGKSIQSIAWLGLHPELKPALVICPASLKLNWAKEIEMTLYDKKVFIINGRQGYTLPKDVDIFIINYDILPNKFINVEGSKKKKEISYSGWVDYIIDAGVKVTIMDEAHLTKSSTALRTKACMKLSKKTDHVIGLTGTPIVNRPIEIYNAIKMIQPSLFVSGWAFKKRYCNAHFNGFGWDFNGASNTEELHNILTSTIMLRHLKKDVLQDLPDKIYSYVPMQIKDKDEYEDAERDFIQWLRNKGLNKKADKAERAEVITKLNGLKQLAAEKKLETVVEWIRNFINSDGKLVVFAVHKKIIDKLMKEFKGQAVKIDGSVRQSDRQKAVDKFQNDKNIKLFVGNIQAAGVGITLTAASSVAFIELDWVVGNHIQAEDRCHRIGQKNSVNIYYLLAAGTIEEKIGQLLSDKAKVLDSVLDGKSMDETNIFTELLEKISNSKRRIR